MTDMFLDSNTATEKPPKFAIVLYNSQTEVTPFFAILPLKDRLKLAGRGADENLDQLVVPSFKDQVATRQPLINDFLAVSSLSSVRPSQHKLQPVTQSPESVSVYTKPKEVTVRPFVNNAEFSFRGMPDINNEEQMY